MLEDKMLYLFVDIFSHRLHKDVNQYQQPFVRLKFQVDKNSANFRSFLENAERKNSKGNRICQL